MHLIEFNRALSLLRPVRRVTISRKRIIGLGPTFFAILLLGVVLCSKTFAQKNAEEMGSRLLSVSTDLSPPSITLGIPSCGCPAKVIRKRVLGEESWGAPIATVPDSVGSYHDTSVTAGVIYEYQVSNLMGPTTEYVNADWKTLAFVGKQAVEQRGVVVLLVDAVIAEETDLEIRRFSQDLIGDGWQVVRHDVPRSMNAPAIRNLLRLDHAQYGATLKTAIILGHVAVPYSGVSPLDGHINDHTGGWSTDRYYSDLDGSWSDSFNASAIQGVPYAEMGPRFLNRNFPNDGVFDNSETPSAPEISVGRIDFHNLPAFLPRGEGYLLRQYLNKNHRFRVGELSVPQRAIGFMYNPARDSTGSMVISLAKRFGALNSFGGEIFSYAEGAAGSSYLVGYTASTGYYQGMYDSSFNAPSFSSKDLKVVFLRMFGSYFGDFDSSNNLLRAALASGSHTLATWYLTYDLDISPLVRGETLGDCLESSNSVNLNLLGDPTLRIQQTKLVKNVRAAIEDGRIKLRWDPSETPEILGYHIFRAANQEGPFVRLSTAAVVEPNYDLGPASEMQATFMIRPYTLESTAVGSYFNFGQGSFLKLTVENTANGLSLVGDNLTITPGPITPPPPVDLTPKSPTALPITITPAIAKVGDVVTTRYHFAPGPVAEYRRISTQLEQNGSYYFFDDHFLPVDLNGWISEQQYEFKRRVPKNIPGGTYRVLVNFYDGNRSTPLLPGPGTLALSDSVVAVGTLTIEPHIIPSPSIDNVRIVGGTTNGSSIEIRPGHTVTIAWDSVGVEQVKINILDVAGTPISHIWDSSINGGSNTLPNSGSYIWKVPEIINQGTGQTEQNIKIQVVDANIPQVSSTSALTYRLVDDMGPTGVAVDPKVYYSGSSSSSYTARIIWDFTVAEEQLVGLFYRAYHRSPTGAYSDSFELCDPNEFTLTNYSPGPYFFKIQAVDFAGNLGPMSQEFMIDLASPGADSDGDGVPDLEDCAVADATRQKKLAFPDWDSDGFRDSSSLDICECFGVTPPSLYTLSTGSVDNCPFVRSNPDQADLDQDGIGNACDPDYHPPPPPGQPGGFILG